MRERTLERAAFLLLVQGFALAAAVLNFGEEAVPHQVIFIAARTIRPTRRKPC